MKAAGITVVAISYDPVETLAKFASKSKITFPLLSDTGSKTIKAYGVLNIDLPEADRGIPYPGTFVIDKQGIVRAKLFREGYKLRHDTAELIAAAKQ